MNPKDRFDACMKLAEFGAGRWDARRTYEWRLSLGLWALLAGAIHLFRVDTIPGWVIIFGPTAYLWWIRNIWWSNFLDREFMRTYRDHARNILKIDHVTYEYEFKRPFVAWLSKHPALNKLIGFLFDWAALFQIAVTFGLGFLALKFCQTKPSATWIWF